MIHPQFEKISVVRLSATQKAQLASDIALHGYVWTHSSFDWLKQLLKTKLRNKQAHRCCYCRRPLRFDKGLVEIEHIVNKAKNGLYDRFTFTLKNLALACKDCNNGKGIKPVLTHPLSAGSAYPKKAAAFEWVHPYFHTYSDHILIHNAWVYEANGGSKEGLAVIVKCKLDLLCDKERANREMLIDTAQDFQHALSLALGMVSEVGIDRLCQELSPKLKRMMARGSGSGTAEQALRQAYTAVMRVANNLPAP